MAQVNDVVLIYFEDQPLAYARVEDIAPDVKKNWYQVRLLLLQIPLQTVTWILRDVYIAGEEFTMGGKAMRLEKVVAPPEAVYDEPEKTEKKSKPSKNKNGAKVVSFTDLKPKK